ncbi:transcriptional regulator, MarR family [Parafrankia sp. EAN1pec]|uniref:MarR family winged helix-turn-helix transcriptional regulator n=1 Tax=Parafrankia sp. (strain EAN1pec) TaxID=298653 RepID=UPI00015D9F35|nr:transcriptional regulator, MarR family [Frankia sp. EAN1pec]
MIESAAGEAWRAMQALVMGGEGHNRLHQICQEVELTPAALKMLLVLSSGARPMRDLVSAFRFDPSYLTSVVDTLERRGLARREPHPTDRRAKTVTVTDEGRLVVSRAQELMAVPPASFGVLSPAEQEQLLGLLLRVLDAEPDIPAAMRPQPFAARSD